MPTFGYATVDEWNYISDGARIESSNYIIISGDENQRLLGFDLSPRSISELPSLPLLEAVPSLTPDTSSEAGGLHTGSASTDPHAQMQQEGIWAKFKKARGRGRWGLAAKKEVAQVAVKQQQYQALQVARKSYQAGQGHFYQKESGDGYTRLSKWCFLGNSSPAKRVIRWTGDSQRGYFPRTRLYFHSNPVSRTFVFNWGGTGSQTEIYLCEAGGNVVKLARGDPEVEGVRFTSLGEPLVNIAGFEKTKLATLIGGSVQADAVLDSLMGMNNFWQEYRYMADLNQAATKCTASPINEDCAGKAVLKWRSNNVNGDTYRDVITNNVPIIRFPSPQMPIDGARSRVEGEPEPRINVENSPGARLNPAKSVSREEPTASIAIPIAAPNPERSPWPGVYGTVLSLNVDHNLSPNEEALESYTPYSYADKFSSRPPASLYPCASRTAASAKFGQEGNLVTNQLREHINPVNQSQQQSDRYPRQYQQYHQYHQYQQYQQYQQYRQYHHSHNATQPLQVVKGFDLPPDNPASVLDINAQRLDFLERVGRTDNWNMYPPIQVAPEYLPVMLRALDWTGRVGDCNGFPDDILNGRVPPPSPTPPSPTPTVRRIT